MRADLVITAPTVGKSEPLSLTGSFEQCVFRGNVLGLVCCIS